jgi:hypothetical protein
MAARIDLEIQAPGHYTSEVLIYPSPFEPRRVCRVWITSAGFKEIFWILNAFSKRSRSAGKGGGGPGQIRSEHQAHFVSRVEIRILFSSRAMRSVRRMQQSNYAQPLAKVSTHPIANRLSA